ncbi:MAG: LPXTG cell wall anchor domain-containing protein [Acidimicrobiales bacterium]
MLRSTLRLLALTLVGLVAVAGPAAAGEEYEPPPGIEVDDSTPGPGDTVTISGESCAVGAEVTITLAGEEVATATVGDDGTFSTTFDVPADAAPGDYEVEVIGCGAEVLGTTITVSGPAPTPAAGGALPETGSSDTEPLVRTGAVLLAAGAVLVFAVRRRQQASAG